MKTTIPFDIFAQVDMRVGLVTAASIPEWSQKLIELQVHFGEEIGSKTILTGVKAWYGPADFIDKKFIFVVNLAERKMGEGVSQGMVLMADGEQPWPLMVNDAAQPGAEIR